MSKNIIFCADGTWNGPGEPDSDDKTATPTNVFKTFLNLDGLDDPGTSTNVKRGRHAIAIDEQRGDFTPTLWDADDRIVQVLFPGAHADVGGGYPLANNESGLSDGAFKWMSDELANLGVRFAAPPSCPPKPNSQGTAHRPWAHPPFDKLLPDPRTFPKGLCLSKSVLDRIGGAAVIADPGLQAAAYAPGNLSDYLAGQAAVAGIKVV
jgi:hypothetical protein